MSSAKHILGLGNAIVDIIAHVDDKLLQELQLEKGAMTLIDEERSDFLYERMPPGLEVSGGSCANTMAAIAALGGAAGYVGRVRNDQFGKVFSHDIRAAGVEFENAPSPSGPATARCLVFVTDDAQRTMQTYLGACVELGPGDVNPVRAANAAITYLEGYLWDRADAKAACRKAADHCHKGGGQLALTLSDSFCVDRWRDEFRELVRDEVDILFANESEIMSLYETGDFDAAAAMAASEVKIAALTRSEKGSIVVSGQERHCIEPVVVDKVVDTTGAGDLYAAGMLYGIVSSLDLAASGRLASHAAGLIVGRIGARADEELKALIAKAA